MTHAQFAQLLDAIAGKVTEPAASALSAAVERHRPVRGDTGLTQCQPCARRWPCHETQDIIGHLGVVFEPEPPVAPVAPPEARTIGFADDVTLAYIVTGEAWYAHTMTERERRQLDIIARSSGGGVAWEFSVEEFDYNGGCVRVNIFSDAFDAFAELPDFFAALQVEKPSTLEHVRSIAARVGAWDATQRVRGDR